MKIFDGGLFIIDSKEVCRKIERFLLGYKTTDESFFATTIIWLIFSVLFIRLA